MFCSKCGCQNSDDAGFCSNCGNPLQNSAPQAPVPPAEPAPAHQEAPAYQAPQQPAYQAPQQAPYQAPYQAPGSVPPPANPGKKSKAPIIVISIILILAIAAAALYFTGVLDGVFGRSADATMDEFVEIMKDMEVSRILDIVPQDVLDATMEDNDMDMDDMVDELKDVEDNMKDSLEMMEEFAGDKVSVKFEVGESEYLDDDDFFDLADQYEDEYDTIIDDAISYEFSMSITAGDESEDNTTYIVLVKIGSSWYLDVNSMADIM